MRMLGDMRGSSCPLHRDPPGPDCPDVGKDTRAAKRIEQRAVLADWQAELDADYERSLLPPYDITDCQHGCGGGRFCYEPCSFMCHTCENCTRPARHWLDTGWFCSPECYGEYGLQLIQGLRQ